ncbi:hypothetical protein BXZ70DRAFT_949514 [Cristinia sonorae]|uniref:F-box domain-containing protein n=1 Tax=Cristinia sonorae TaxID=1940300 RepID=A0A8K0UI48_9AGAR|nr:hypothetical protein BXZ70DRAFT_949514 [Cristinia sonorae]
MSASSESTIPQLPVEVWENVIDNISSPDNLGISLESRKQLATCSQVCRSWLPRCLFHLYSKIVLKSASDLDAIVHRLHTSAGLADRVQYLELHCYSESGPSQSWVCLAPLRLPPLRNLSGLYFFGLDLTARPPHFYPAFRQLRYVASPLNSATHVELDWLFPHARTVYVQVPRPDPQEDVFGMDERTWRRMGTLFQEMTRRHGATDPVGVLLRRNQRYEDTPGPTHDPELVMQLFTLPAWTGNNQPNHDRVVRLQFGSNSTTALSVIARAIRGIAASGCPLHLVVLPSSSLLRTMHQVPEPEAAKQWNALDDSLVATADSDLPQLTLPGLDVTTFGDVSGFEKEMGEDWVCIHDAFRKRLPQTASRGLLQCGPDAQCGSSQAATASVGRKGKRVVPRAG